MQTGTTGSEQQDTALPEQIRAAANTLGYVACGFTRSTPFSGYADEINERLADASPDATHEYEKLLKRVDPTRTAPWARSIVVCIRRYGKYDLPANATGHIGKSYLGDRRNPCCPDYPMPKQMTKALKALGMKVKRGGVVDRAAAHRAGLVAIGRNSVAYSPEYGSWINIETWRVSAELPEGSPLPEPCPPGCRRCMRHCPTGAITAPYRVQMTRCVAYLTYDAPDPLDSELAKKIPPWIYGCDICQDVCPMNNGRWSQDETPPWIDEIADALTPAALATMTLEMYRDKIHPLFGYIPPTADGLARWQRNARRVLDADDR